MKGWKYQIPQRTFKNIDKIELEIDKDMKKHRKIDKINQKTQNLLVPCRIPIENDWL